MTRKMILQILWWCVLLAGVWLFLRWFEWRNIYFPTREVQDSPEAFGMNFENVDFTTADGVKLNGWFIPITGAKQTVLLCHGNGGNIGDRADKLLLLHQLGVNVFIFDYRGYGRSAGIPSESGTYQDGLAAYDWLRAKKSVEPSDLIVYGESLGSAIAVELATQRPVAGVVLESAFSSVPDMARAVYPWLPLHLICRYRYDNLAKIPKLKTPLLMMHSRTDEIVPYDQGLKLFVAAHDPKQFVELRGGHNDGFDQSQGVYRDALREFFLKLR